MASTTRSDFRSGEPSGFGVPRRTSTAGVESRRSPVIDLPGIVNVSCTPSPTWCAVRSLIATATGGAGGTGSPGAPQPVMTSKTKLIQRLPGTTHDLMRDAKLLRAGRRSLGGGMLIRLDGPFR